MNLLIAKIGSQADIPTLRDKLHQVQHYTNQIAKDTNQLVKDLTRMPVQGNQSEQRQRKIQRDRLVNDFATVLNNFQSAQRSQKTKEAAIASRSTTLNEELTGSAQGSTDVFAQPQQRDQMTLSQVDSDLDLDLLRQQEASVKKLESDIMDINKIFKDLSLLVHEQGDVVDSIESNMESSSLNVSRGLDELRQARDYQAKVRRRKLCIGIIVVVIILIIIIAISIGASRR